jgi:uncharacterized protein (DUF1501 family)
MDRRAFLSLAGWSGAFAAMPALASHRSIDTLVIVELDGGNDGLNTVIPFADPRYRALRPTLAIAREAALPIDRAMGLHPSLAALVPAWRSGQLAIVQGVGDPEEGHASHFRSKQIWATASHDYASANWLNHAATFDAASFAAVAQTIAQRKHGMLHITLHGFDTHERQADRHALLLTQLAQGLASLRARLMHSGDWNRTLILTISEFGRSAYENASGGTEHGSASSMFVLGGSVRGGLYGDAPRLNELSSEGALSVDIDFRRIYATALEACSIDSTKILGSRFEPLKFV